MHIFLDFIVYTLTLRKVSQTCFFFFQTVFADQPQVAYIQQDGTTQQVTLQCSSAFYLCV